MRQGEILMVKVQEKISSNRGVGFRSLGRGRNPRSYALNIPTSSLAKY